jgi:apolipoprotein N-acyltransferase
LGSGLVFATSTPPLDFEAGILLGLVGFGLALDDARRHSARAAVGVGFVFGLSANLLGLRFVPAVIERFTPLPAAAGVLAWMLLAAAQAVPWAVAGALHRWLRGKDVPSETLPAWLAFATSVYGATFVPTLFAWTPAGGLAGWPRLLQGAEIVGERGASFFVAAVCGLLAAVAAPSTASLQRRRLLGAAAATMCLLGVYGTLRERSIEAVRRRSAHAMIGLVEPDFDPVLHWDPNLATASMVELSRLTREAESDGAALTIWPESAYPYTLAHGTNVSPSGPRSILQPGVHGPVLTGLYMAMPAAPPEQGLGTNSAILARGDGSLSPSYDKRHLLWFGETVPLAETFPVLRRVFARGTGLVAGNESVRFVAGSIVFAVLNCYEDTLPAAGREAMSVRPNLLVNVTNDTWFSGSIESELHLRLATLRAIESRRDLVRAVNRGPTSWVAATGRVLARRESPPGAGAPAPLVVDAALLDTPPTPYVRFGDAPLAVALGLLVAFRIGRRRLTRRTTPSLG